MPHANAPLTPTGRLRMGERHLNDGIPIGHIAAEFRVSRPTDTNWIHRYQHEGLPGVKDRPSRPISGPAQTHPQIVHEIEQLRRTPQRIHTTRPGQMVRLDVKKLGRIPAGGGWWAHGRGTPAALASKRQGRVDYTYPQSAIDGHTRLAYTKRFPMNELRPRPGSSPAPGTSPGPWKHWPTGISGSGPTPRGKRAGSGATTG